MVGELIDQEARDLARDAMARIVTHEQVSVVQWKQSADASARVEQALGDVKKAISNRIGITPVSVISALMALCGFLAARVWH